MLSKTTLSIITMKPKGGALLVIFPDGCRGWVTSPDRFELDGCSAAPHRPHLEYMRTKGFRLFNKMAHRYRGVPR